MNFAVVKVLTGRVRVEIGMLGRPVVMVEEALVPARLQPPRPRHPDGEPEEKYQRRLEIAKRDRADALKRAPTQWRRMRRADFNALARLVGTIEGRAQ